MQVRKERARREEKRALVLAFVGRLSACQERL